MSKTKLNWIHFSEPILKIFENNMELFETLISITKIIKLNHSIHK